jgi:hypothetical protein
MERGGPRNMAEESFSFLFVSNDYTNPQHRFISL